MPLRKKTNFSHRSALARHMRRTRNVESQDDRLQRLERERQRQQTVRAAETDEETNNRLRNQAAYKRTLRANEPIQRYNTRLRMQAHYQVATRATQSEHESNERRANQLLRQANIRQIFLRNTWESLYRAAFNYDASINYRDCAITSIGTMNNTCVHCRAMKWNNEAPGLCCSSGKVSIPFLREPPEPLKSYLSQASQDSQYFLNNIRTYNSAFQMTSFGADKQCTQPGFSPTFTIQGQIYHRIGSILPSTDVHAFLQIYFMGNEAQINRRCAIFENVHKDIIGNLQDMLLNHNNLIKTFKMAKDRMPNDNYKIVIHADRVPSGEHERLYNAPVVNEVAVLIVGEEILPRDIVIHSRCNGVRRISDTHRFYDALQYPLIFWDGQETYHFNIPLINPETGHPLPRKKVSAMNFYAYHLMIRENNFNSLLRYRNLLNQFLVDMYVKIESERLRFILLNQDKLRADSYIHLRDAVNNDANVDPTNLGQLVILPSTFINSPRYLHEYTQDTFTYVRAYGRPDLFITFTCNPSWPEFNEILHDGEKVYERHDLIARVFRLKVKKLMDILRQGNIFGETLCFIYSIEWQKRGLPHVHILLWLKDKIRPNNYDQIISAEIPDHDEDPLLYEIVKSNMIHGPCGSFNKSSPCMIDGRCTKRYPRTFLKETQTSEDGYPLYRRRSPEDGGKTVTKRIRGGEEFKFDNRWIVPYCPLLSNIFDAHINVEICNSVQAIKYICKYINKGCDKAIFNMQNNNENRKNEVNTYQAGRYVSSNEAAWRIFSFPLHERHPTVTHLAVHLQNGQRVYFNEQNFNDTLINPPDTTLTAFFKLCQIDPFAATLLYSEVPQYYTWNISKKQWNRRKIGTPVESWPGVKSDSALGRVYTVHISNFECYCLRLLLHQIKGPSSFIHLRTINGIVYDTFKEACEALHLLEDDNHWEYTLQESILSKNTNQIRELFAILLTMCGLTDPKKLWIKYRNDMSDDILHRYRLHDSQLQFNDNIYNEALLLIEHHVITISGKTIDNFGIPQPHSADASNFYFQRYFNYDINQLRLRVTNELPTLLPQQRDIFNLVINQTEKTEGAIIFIDAPGGTGKTYLINLLLAYIRQNQQIAIAVASSGIAATLLDGGRTAHSALRLPLNLIQLELPMCIIQKNSNEANLLRQCKLLVWDEVTMSHKKSLEALDRTLKDIRSNTSIMGGLTVLLAGDFRQTLPVISKGTPTDELNACIKSSYLWQKVIKKTLTVNMRLSMSNDNSAKKFAGDLLKIGEGKMHTDNDGKIHFTEDFCNIVQSVEDLIDRVFPDIHMNYKSQQWLCERALLAPTNDFVDMMNNTMLDKIPGDCVTLNSLDTVINQDDITSYPVEFLNSINMSGIPSHKLRLKVGALIILMRNLNAPKLCNGTRLRITNIGSNILTAEVLTGSFASQQVLIPRIPIIPTELPFQFKRVQFPIKLAFAISINKSQGQTLKVVGINLLKSCFSHGQLYVACSRTTSKSNLFVLAPGGTHNIVYERALL